MKKLLKKNFKKYGIGNLFFFKYSNMKTTGLGIRSFAHHSFAQINQNKWATVSDSLILLKTNERLWANRSWHSWKMSDLLRSLRGNERSWAIRSDRLEEMSDHEQIAQVAHQKQANVSDALRSLRTK